MAKSCPEFSSSVSKCSEGFRKVAFFVRISDSTPANEPTASQPMGPEIRQSRVISAVNSSLMGTVYRVSKMHASPTVVGRSAWCEIDNHADTCCLGKNFIPLAYTNRVCDVHAFTDQVNTVDNIPVVTGATAIGKRQSPTSTRRAGRVG